MTRPLDAPVVAWSEVCSRRLERHALASPATDASPAEIAGTLCGVHAQILTAGEVSLGIRLTGSSRQDIQQALWTDRSLVKTFGPRGTVHLLATRDLPLWTGALSAIPAANAFPEEIRLTAGEADEIVATIAEALADAELTVDALTEALVARLGPWAGEPVMPAFQAMWPRWRMVTHMAAQRGALCFGPNRGRKVTYTSPQRWLPGFRPVEAQEALAGIVKRYLHAYGPATPGQFARWIGAPAGWATTLFETLAPALNVVALEGERAWVNAGDMAFPSAPARSVRLLPYFDAYAVGCHPRERVFPGRAAERALARGQAGNYPVLLIGGVVAGVWHQRRAGKAIAITVEPLQTLTAAQRRELDEQVERIGVFLDGAPRLTIGEVTVGPHA